LARPLDGGLDLLRELRQLLHHLDRPLRVVGRLEFRTLLLQACKQLLRLLERVLGAARLFCHVTLSRTIRPRMPFTSRAASSEAKRFASVTASSITTSGGTSPASSSWRPTRSTFRSTRPSRSAGQPVETSVIR